MCISFYYFTTSEDGIVSLDMSNLCHHILDVQGVLHQIECVRAATTLNRIYHWTLINQT